MWTDGSAPAQGRSPRDGRREWSGIEAGHERRLEVRRGRRQTDEGRRDRSRRAATREPPALAARGDDALAEAVANTHAAICRSSEHSASDTQLSVHLPVWALQEVRSTGTRRRTSVEDVLRRGDGAHHRGHRGRASAIRPGSERPRTGAGQLQMLPRRIAVEVTWNRQEPADRRIVERAAADTRTICWHADRARPGDCPECRACTWPSLRRPDQRGRARTESPLHTSPRPSQEPQQRIAGILTA